LKTIYLASKSPRRKELLRQVGIPFELMPLREHPPERRDVDESPYPDEPALQYVKRIARTKAEVAGKMMLSRRLPLRLILAADTTVVLNGAILGKPVDRDDAIRMLRNLSGSKHEVLTAVAVTDGRDLKEVLSRSEVTFRALDDSEIARYVSTGEPLDKAGAYAIQGRAAVFVSHLSGSYSGVMGLPLHETAQLLTEFDKVTL
jgi:septum formation protein